MSLRLDLMQKIDEGKTLTQILQDVQPEDLWTTRQTYAEILRDRVREEQDETFVPVEPLISKKGIQALNAGWLRPVQLNFDTLPPAKIRGTKQGKVTGIISDLHYPTHDPHAIDVTFQICRAAGIDELIINGDLFDCASLSKYTPAPEQHLRWVSEREVALKEIVKIRQNFPDIPIKFLVGNHDERPIKWINANAVPLQGLFPLAHWLGIDDPKLNIQVVEENKIMLAEDSLMVKHGTVVSQQSGDSVKKEINRAGCSVIMGHVHRRAWIEITKAEQELTGIELGCLQTLRPDYLPTEDTANWQQGFAIITELGEGRFSPELIKIDNGTAFYRGKLYESRI